MTGAELKKIIIAENYTVAEVARRIGTSQQNLTCSLSKNDIRTGLLEKVAEAMDRPLSFFYGERFGTSLSVQGNNNTQVAGNSNNVSTSDSEILALLRAKDEQLTLAMQQTSCAQMQTNKAQEQMDRVLERLLGKN